MADSAAPLETLLARLRQDAGPRASLRLRRIEALAARMAGSEDPVRAVLEQRLRALLGDPGTAASLAPIRSGADPSPGKGLAALAELRARLRAGHGQASTDAVPQPGGSACHPDASTDDDASGAGPAALPALQAARQTWARLRMVAHLRHVLAEVPDDAGPLHSTVLVHRAIAVMQEAAPGYLQHFLGYADALAALERIAPAPTAAPAPRSPRPSRPSSPANAPAPGKARRQRSTRRRVK